MHPESGFNDLSKTVKFNFVAMPMVGIVPVSDLKLQRGEVSGGSCCLGGEYSRVIAESDNAARVGVQRTFQNGEIQLWVNANGGNITCSRFEATAM